MRGQRGCKGSIVQLLLKTLFTPDLLLVMCCIVGLQAKPNSKAAENIIKRRLDFIQNIYTKVAKAGISTNTLKMLMGKD